eukprot:14563765-Alexandrium_andersonii.AAC.1
MSEDVVGCCKMSQAVLAFCHGNYAAPPHPLAGRPRSVQLAWTPTVSTSRCLLRPATDAQH